VRGSRPGAALVFTALEFALLAALVPGCAPSKFNGLTGGRDSGADEPAQDAEAHEDSGDLDAEPDPGDLDADLDPPDEGSEASDATEASVGEAGAEDGSSADAGDAGDAQMGCPDGGTPRPLRATSLIEFTRLKRPASVKTRVLGPSAWLGTTRTWLYSQTTLASPEAMPPAVRPDNLPSLARDGAGTQVWQKPNPTPEWQLQEVLEAGGKPKLLTPLNAAEQNMSVSLYPVSLIRDPLRERGGLVFLFKSPGFFQPSNEVWIARMDDGGYTAMRNATSLFKPGEPLFGVAAHVGAAYVKLLGCKFKAATATEPVSWPCFVARAPLDKVMERAAYEFYVVDAQGGSWSTQLARATAVVSASDATASISWNPYLNKFLVVNGVSFDNKVVMQAASSIEGPWTERVELALPKPKFTANLEVREHPSIAQRCGQRIFVSYWSPTEVNQDGWPSAGEVMLGAIDLE
jgi:hypothetical protein